VTELHMVEIAALLRQLSAQLITSDDLDAALVHLADTAAGLVDGSAWCGMTVVRTGEPSTAVSSPGLPAKIDEEQYVTGDGPSMHAMSAREIVICSDLATETRWAKWREQAAEVGVHGVLAVPVDIDEHVIGALSLYSADPGVLTSEVGFIVMLVAEHAGLLLSAVLDRSRLTDLTARLTAALRSGETVNQAIGIVMAQRACSADAALEVLLDTSTQLHLPLATVAQRLVDTVAHRAS
jgi:transcriptional regulator with GAF, ATPase, and Fis domain